MAHVYRSLRQYEQALLHYQKALDVDPDHDGKFFRRADVYSRRAEIHMELNQYDEALAECNKSVEVDPDNGRAALVHAQILLMTDRTQEYRQACVDMLDRFGRSEQPRTFCLAARACVLGPEAISDTMRSVELAERAVSNDPESPSFLYTLGMAHFRAGHLEQAGERFHDSLEASPDWPGRCLAWLGLALLDHRGGQQEEARQWLAKAIELMDRHPSEDTEDRIEGQLLRREVEQLLGKPEQESDAGESEQGD
jgi:tetratricopeptide (TPR) repeat protein